MTLDILHNCKLFSRKRLLLALVLLWCVSFPLWLSLGYIEVSLSKQIPEAHDTNGTQQKSRGAVKAPDPDVIRFVENARKTMMNETYKRHYLRILLEFDSIWRVKLGHDYHMNYGTLLGAVRYQGFLPYDDDIDLIADRRDILLMEVELGVKSSLAVFANGPNKRKVFFKDNQLTRTRKWWGWPCLDVYFYSFLNNDTEIQDPEIPSYRLPYSAVFPTIFLPFEGYRFPAPRCYYKALEVVFGNDVSTRCCPAYWNHRIERYGPDPNGPCVDCKPVSEYFNVSLTLLPRETEEVCRF